MAPSLILLVLLIGYPLVYNIVISFQDVPLNPNMPSEFVGLKNFIDVFTGLIILQFCPGYFPVYYHRDSDQYCIGPFAVGVLKQKIFRQKAGKFYHHIVICGSVCMSDLTWRYMFNNIYGIINYVVVDLLHLTDEAPLWFDQPASAFILVALLQYGNFSRMRIFHYCYFAVHGQYAV